MARGDLTSLVARTRRRGVCGGTAAGGAGPLDAGSVKLTGAAIVGERTARFRRGGDRAGRGRGVSHPRRDAEIPAVLGQARDIRAGGRPVVVDVAVDYSAPTFFTRAW
jgi:hypothetical protein